MYTDEYPHITAFNFSFMTRISAEVGEGPDPSNVIIGL
jgi:hypothetical protein